MKLGMCLVCDHIFTITDAMVNVLNEDSVVSKFQCTNCGAITKIVQQVETKPTYKFKKASEIHV